MASVRQSAGCIGLGGDLSIIGDFFGYVSHTRAPLSLLTQLQLLQGPHIHLNLIRVAIDGGEWQLPDDEANIDEEVRVARSAYATVGLGIGRVQRFFIPAAMSDGHEHLASPSEAKDLWNKWVVPNDGIDAFFVLTLAGSAGVADINGPCDNAGKHTAGAVVAVRQMVQFKNFKSLGHEVGHYLGLEHAHDVANNLMEDPVDHGGTDLTPDQGAIMRDHCSVQPGC